MKNIRIFINIQYSQRLDIGQNQIRILRCCFRCMNGSKNTYT